MNTSQLKRVVFFFLIFLLGILGGAVLYKTFLCKLPKTSGLYYTRLFKEGSHRVNPLFLVEKPEGGDQALVAAKTHIRAYISKCVKEGDADSVSVYLRTMDDGNWVEINPGEYFSEASLIKVPLLIAYLNIAEKDPSILAEKIECRNWDTSVPQNIVPRKSIQPGGVYTIDELLRYMIVYSDNGATEILYKNINPALMDKLYSTLQIKTKDMPLERLTTAKSYASFFRVLYSATYLNEQMSEKALNLLTETDFPDGLTASVPAGTVVAHKFAERAYTASPEKQLHDCGIVYYPKRTYMICVMTRGKNVTNLKKVIQDISRIAYQQLMEETW